MKAKLIIVLLLLLNSTILLAQVRIDWQQCYGSMETDNAYGIIQCDNHFLVVGYVGEQSGMVGCNLEVNGGSWLIKIDENSHLIGEECFTDFGASFQGLKLGKDNSFYLVGLNEVEYMHNVIEVRKYDHEGNLIWITQAGDPLKNFLTSAYAATTPDGGIVVTHYAQWPCGSGGEYYGMDDTWVVKINSEGRQEWETMLGTEGIESPTGAFCDSSGNSIIFIYGIPVGNGNLVCCNHTSYDGVVVKLDEYGGMLWNRCYGGNDEDYFKGAVELENGYLLFGVTASDDGDLESAGYHLGYYNGQSWNNQTRDIWLMKTDFEGNIIWSKCYGGTGDDYPAKVFQNDDGGFTVFGTSNSIDGDVQSGQNLHLPWNGTPSRKIWAFRTDAEGNLLWERAIGHKGNDINLSDVIKHNEKEYTLVATSGACVDPEYQGDYNCTNAPLLEHGYKNWWVLHITDIFNYDDPTGIEEQPKVVPLQMNVHPNPATTWVAIDYTLPNGNAKAELSVFNAMGVKVKQVELEGNEGQKVLDLRGLAPGVYFITLYCDGLEQTGKLVLM